MNFTTGVVGKERKTINFEEWLLKQYMIKSDLNLENH